jgi:hypothetical protein
MKASAISIICKDTGTNTTDPKNTSKATKGNTDEGVKDTTARVVSGGTPGRAGRGGTARANVPPPLHVKILTTTSVCNGRILLHIAMDLLLRERPTPPNQSTPSFPTTETRRPFPSI